MRWMFWLIESLPNRVNVANNIAVTKLSHNHQPVLRLGSMLMAPRKYARVAPRKIYRKTQ